MENNTTQQQSQNDAQPSRSSSPASIATTSSWKPLPSLPSEAPPPPAEPYQDEPSTPIEGTATAQSRPPRYNTQSEVQTYFPPYTDAVPGTEDNDDVPLAHLYPYPTEAPPAYNVVVRQSYRDTLISHIPSNSNLSPATDEEAGIERDYYDDNRFKIERVVAAFILSIVLLVITGFLIASVVFHKTFSIGFKWA